MRTVPQGPSLELLLGPRSAVLGGGDACKLRHWNLRWRSLLGHEAPAVLGGGDACELRHWDVRWTYGAAKHCIRWGRRMRTAPLGPSLELPMGPRRP
eukprot:5133119-Pyramimonas_sp.AAC.1